MIDEQSVVSVGRFDGVAYERSQAAERALNDAILRAEIAGGYEEFLAIFGVFYADDVEISRENSREAIRGKEKVRSLLGNFLVPLHVMAEIGGLLVSIRHTPMPGDVTLETHSAWTLELVGVSGTTCTVKWRVLRKWLGRRVVYEHHYDHQWSGEPLTSKDFSFHSADAVTSIQRPS